MVCVMFFFCQCEWDCVGGDYTTSDTGAESICLSRRALQSFSNLRHCVAVIWQIFRVNSSAYFSRKGSAVVSVGTYFASNCGSQKKPMTNINMHRG